MGRISLKKGWRGKCLLLKILVIECWPGDTSWKEKPRSSKRPHLDTMKVWVDLHNPLYSCCYISSNKSHPVSPPLPLPLLPLWPLLSGGWNIKRVEIFAWPSSYMYKYMCPDIQSSAHKSLFQDMQRALCDLCAVSNSVSNTRPMTQWLDPRTVIDFMPYLNKYKPQLFREPRRLQR